MFLALHTSNLTYLYNQVLLARGQRQTEEEESILDDFRLIIGNSIVGDWSSVMLHNVVKNSDFKTEGLKDDFSSASLNLHPMLASNNIVCKMKLPEKTEEPKNSEKSALCRGAIIEAVIDTFSLLVPYKQKIEVNIEENSIELKTSEPAKMIDMFGFVMRHFDSKKHKERLKNRLIINDKSEEALEKKCSTSWENIISGTEDYQDCALPIYSLDVYYNFLKRLYENKDIHFENMDYEGMYSLKETDIKKIVLERDDIDMVTEYAQGYLKLLYRVRHLLNRQDEYYNKDNDLNLLELEKKFSGCPFVSQFFDLKSDDDSTTKSSDNSTIKSGDDSTIKSGDDSTIELDDNSIAKYSLAVIGCVLFDFYKKQTVTDNGQLNTSSEEESL